jgi:major membrane immunogen (membrane-anchored lipoprotein)
MRYLLNTFIVFSLVFLTACSGKLTKENYDKISTGMSLSEVENILGKGESQASSNIDMGEFGGNVRSEVITWQKWTKVISITFSNGKVMSKAQTGL